MRARGYVAVAAVLVAWGGAACVVGCSGSAAGDCNKEMERVRSQYGNPEEVSTYSSSGYHSQDWWYWTRGIEFTFVWGENVGGCEKSTYTFSPIRGAVDSLSRDRMEGEARGMEAEATVDGGCAVCP